MAAVRMFLPALAAASLLARGAGAQDTSAQAADQVLAAVRAEDTEALRELAARDEPDPWLVADELWFRGERAAAETFVDLGAWPDAARLAAYVRGLAPDPGAARRREGLLEAAKLQIQKEHEQAIALLAGILGEGCDVTAVRVLKRIAYVQRDAKRFDDSARSFLEAAGRCERLGWLLGTDICLHQAGLSAYNGGDLDVTAHAWERLLAQRRTLGNEQGALFTVGNLGVVHFGRGDFDRAAHFFAEAVRGLEAAGKEEAAAGYLGNEGAAAQMLSDFPRARACYERSFEIAMRLDLHGSAVSALNNLGTLCTATGDFAAALGYLDQALAIEQRRNEARSIAEIRANRGTVHYRLGELDAALQEYRLAHQIFEREKDPIRAAMALGNIGNVLSERGDLDAAREVLAQALRVAEERGDLQSQATWRAGLAEIHRERGELARAAEGYRQVIDLLDRLGDEDARATVRQNLALVCIGAGDLEQAESLVRESIASGERIGNLRVATKGYVKLAAILVQRKAAQEALAAAHRAVELLPTLVRGLGEEQGAAARETFSEVFEWGAAAAVEAGDPAELAFFLESGRAGSLLESLGGRAAVATLVSGELRAEEVGARSAQMLAARRLRAALGTGDRVRIHACRAELEAAQEQLLDVVARIRRNEKAAADVLYPQALELVEVQALLRSDEALVLFSLLTDQALAQVISHDATRWCVLGTSEEVRAACEAMHGLYRAPDAEPSQAIGALRRLVWQPLALDEKMRRVLVSPDGILTSVPFVLLEPDREIVLVPSGTTYGLLRDTETPSGEKVLALGDPAYGEGAGADVLMRMRGGQGLEPLPATRAEVQRVGDVTLLGAQATEAALAASLRGTGRWRAVHLACHGLVRPDKPQLSALAISPGDGDDGLLTVLDVFRMRVPADLVVLSACETAMGRVYRGEGVIGFTRAFMMAGAPRVIVSLWRVPDEATRALMERFYESWKPGGISTAAALRKAQAYVASQEKWRHPYFWAAWQLWGLGD